MATSKRRVHPSPRSLVDELRRAIVNCGETEYRVAKESGVPQPVLNRFLRGERGISLETAAKLSAYLGLHLR
jgi:plasmid maintenance system antidote protein VapI